MNAIDIHARREPTFTTAQGTFERWQDLVRMRDASIRVERFREEHDRRLAAEHPQHLYGDIAVHRRHYIEGLEKQLERQVDRSRRVGHTMPGIVSVPEQLIGDESATS